MRPPADAEGFWSAARSHPDRVAIIDDGGAETTYGQLLDEQNRAAHGLRALGLHPGDTVAVDLWNQPQFLELALATAQSGLYLLPVNWHLTAPEVAYILRDSQARVLVTAERLADVAAGAADGAGLDVDGRLVVGSVAGFRPYADLKAGQPTTRPADPVAGETMLYTSGTTGHPKGVRRPLSGAAPEAGASTMIRLVPYFFGMQTKDDDVQLVTGPLYHATPGAMAVASMHLGHTLVLMDKWDPQRALELIERHRVTYLHMVPTMFHRLLALPVEVRRRYDVSSLRSVLHGAAPCPVDVKRRMIDWFGPIISEYYGSSEGGGALVRSDDWLQRPGTVGTPWPGSELKILDETGGACPPGTIGTVYMKMPGFDFEYHNSPEKTKESSRDGFFTVGDLGHLDEDGFLFLSGRSADLIISGGANIYPAEIEGALLGHPAVADAAVIGVPNAEWGEEVKAIIELKPGVEPSPDLGGEIIEHCRAQLAGFKIPRSVDFRRDLPRTGAGKLYKRLLQDEYRTAPGGRR